MHAFLTAAMFSATAPPNQSYTLFQGVSEHQQVKFNNHGSQHVILCTSLKYALLRGTRHSSVFEILEYI